MNRLGNLLKTRGKLLGIIPEISPDINAIMMKKTLITLFFVLLAGASILSANGGNAPGNEDIYLITLDDLFLQAGEKWEVEADILWDDYATSDLKVKLLNTYEETGEEEYELHSPKFGKVTLKVKTRSLENTEEEADINLSDFMNDADSRSAEDAE